MEQNVIKLNHRLVQQRCEISGLADVLQTYFSGEKAWILFWEFHRVDFAWYDGEKIFWQDGKPAEYLTEARIFHEGKECRIRNIDGKFVCRILTESEEEPTEEVYKKISMPYMWGSIVNDGVVREDRGMQYHLPCAKEATGFGYVVEEYYKPDEEDGMLKLIDYRMTKIFQEIQYQRSELPIGGVVLNV